jgi:hypothetical protein
VTVTRRALSHTDERAEVRAVQHERVSMDLDAIVTGSGQASVQPMRTLAVFLSLALDDAVSAAGSAVVSR